MALQLITEFAAVDYWICPLALCFSDPGEYHIFLFDQKDDILYNKLTSRVAQLAPRPTDQLPKPAQINT